MPTKSEAIKEFLTNSTHPDLAELYCFNMECQVNVAQDGGDRVEQDFKGRKWHGWTDGLTTWKSFRIPRNANTEPEYTDSQINFSLGEHAEGIGMTGWDWVNKCSRWVAFDFDAIIGHSDKHGSKLSQEELQSVLDAAKSIPWVTIRKSTSGKGLHIYVFLEPVTTANHNEHAALARAILGKMAALTGFDFKSKVDICGGNMWVWHRKMRGTDGLRLIHKGSILSDIPINWRDHIVVISGKRRKNLPHNIEENKIDFFEELCGQRLRVPLDEEHKKLIEFLKDTGALWWWDQDHHMLVTHTIHLKEAHHALGLRGIFETNATGKEKGNDHNCFAFPLRHGAWGIRRYTQGVQEHESWTQDGAGWTKCYLNQEPDFNTACRSAGGLEDPSGGFVFTHSKDAINAARLLGVTLTLDDTMLGRETKLKQHKDGRLIVLIEESSQDRVDKMPGWLRKNKTWTKVTPMVSSTTTETDTANYDDLVRHLVSGDSDYGWVIKSDNKWRDEPKHHIRDALMSMGMNPRESTNIIGTSVLRCWRLVNKPFQPEYPGDREWNRDAVQLKCLPTENKDNLYYPTWIKILSHCGSGLDDFIKQDPWCKANGIISGADYLKCWIAALFKEPNEPLPYLFFYGPQNSGKSIFHEALSLLITKGYKRAENALISQQGFNGELLNALICVVEEIDLRKDKTAYNRIKDWVTARELLVHVKGETPFLVNNTTHWIQCANDHTSCPIFPGDTRITMCWVGPLDTTEMIPKRHIMKLLEQEAADFLADVLSLEIPDSKDRLMLPALATEDKGQAALMNQSMLDMFIEEKCRTVPGAWIKFSDFYDKFVEWLEPNEVHNWSKIKVGREIPPQFARGRSHKDAQHYIGNLYWKDQTLPETPLGKYVKRGEFLEVIDDHK